MSKNETVRRSTRVLSAPVRAAAEARTNRAPLVVQGISLGRLITIKPSAFDRLDVDPSYQRGETGMVGDLIRVLQAGGQVLDPVSLCRRPWQDPDKMWIVDGYQRVCAFQQLQVPFQAILYDSDSLDAEKKFFVSLNSRKAVSADLIVKSWVGPSGAMIRAADANPAHPLCGRIHMQQGTNRAKIGGTILARGMLAAATGLEPNGSAQRVLARLDHAISEKAANKARAEHFMRLFPAVLTDKVPSVFVVIALAHVAYDRWKIEIAPPKTSVIEKLRVIRWDQEVPALTKKYQPVLAELVKRAWRA